MNYHTEINANGRSRPERLSSLRRRGEAAFLAFISFIFILGTAQKTEAQDNSLTPFLTCVYQRPETGKLTAYFGYAATKDVTIRPGTLANIFSPPPSARGQDSKFFTGVYPLSNPVTFDLSTTPQITWTLNGKAVTASLDARRCDVDDLSEQLQFGKVNYLGNEKDGLVEVTVTRSNSSRGAVSVDYSTEDGTALAGLDYVATSGTLNFAEGETSKSFTIPLLNEGQFEDNESILLRLSKPTGGAKIGANNLAVLVIEDKNHFSNRNGDRFDSRDINVNGLTGVVTKLRITLHALVSPNPNTLDVLLVSPTGQKMILMSDVGTAFTAAVPFAGTLTFDDAAATVLPTGVQFTPGTYKPTNYGAGDSFTVAAPYQSPAPAGAATLASTFQGTDPNGTWSLYIQGAQHHLVYGWSLGIETVDCAAIVLDTESLPTATAGTAYNTKLAASGGTSPYNFSIKGGVLPAGMTFSKDGTLSGTPTQAGSFPLSILATDANGCNGVRAYTLSVGQGAITLSPSVIPGGALGQSFATTFAANNGVAPFIFSLGGTLPVGLSFSGQTLSGTPTQGGIFPITVTVKDANGSQASANYTLVINRPPSLSGVSNMIAEWNKLLTFTAVGKDTDVPQQSLTYSLVNAPTGAAINPTTGVFTWTPTGPQLGAFTFSVRVTDNGSPTLSTSRTVTITVDAGSANLSITNIIPVINSSAVTATALLTNAGNDSPLKNRAINFKLGDAVVKATTNNDGMANASLVLPDKVAPYTLITTFEGDDFAQSVTVVTTFNVTQIGDCTNLIFPTSLPFKAEGGAGSLQINTTRQSCRWTVSSDDSWLKINGGRGGAGNGKVSFIVAANPNLLQRTGTLNIAGMEFKVLQDGLQFDAYNELTSLLNVMKVLRSTATDKREQRKLDDAIQNLSNALAPALWIDQTHLQPDTDEKAFKQIRQTLRRLIELLKDKRDRTSDETLLNLIHIIVRAVRVLALVAVNEAAGLPEDKRINQAQKEVAAGDGDVTGGRSLNGIERFWNARVMALRAFGRE